MNRFLFSFLKRFIIIPVLFTAVVSVAMVAILPSVINSSAPSASEGNRNVDISLYNLVEYESFDVLEQGDYVAEVKLKDIDMCCALCYASADNSKDVALIKNSVEPWNNGSIIIEGFESSGPLKDIRRAKPGNEIEIDFYKNKAYTYTIKSVDYDKTYEQAMNQAESSDLVLAIPYNDFENPDNSKLYITYTADLGGVN